MTRRKEEGSMIVLKNNLKEIRTQKGITQIDLAEQVGVTRMTISSLENGRFCPTAKLAAELASLLEVKFEDLFYLDKANIDRNISTRKKEK